MKQADKRIRSSNIPTYKTGAAQAAVHRTLQKHCDDILKPYGITKMQWLILGHVLDAGEAGARMTDIAKTLATTLPYLTNTLNVLEAKGYIVRGNNKGDNRSKLIRIRPEFIPRCTEIEDILSAGLREHVYAHISPADLGVYMKVLFQLAGSADLIAQAGKAAGPGHFG